MNNCHDFRYGKIMYNVLDSFVGRSLMLYGEYSNGEAELFAQLIHKGDAVIEVGANIGVHTVRLSQLAGREGTVFAFEPQRMCFQLLCGNLALNSLTNVYAYQKCVSDKHEIVLVPQLDTNVYQNWGGLSLIEEKYSDGENIEAVTIDSLNLKKCNFLKIDAEGMELNVLKGAVSTIEQFRPIIYLEVDREDKNESVIKFCQERGYNVYYHTVNLYNQNNYFQNPNNVFKINNVEMASFNALFIHRESNVKVECY